MDRQPMLRLIYLSRVWRNMTNTQLDDILAESRKNNAKNKVTGLLCYGGSSFIQILEGPETAVIQLYGKISQDERHHGCMLLDIHLANKRIFENWAMAYVHSSKADFDELSDVIQGAHKKHEQAVSEMTQILRAYLGQKVNLQTSAIS
jgi:hypothetical protein